MQPSEIKPYHRFPIHGDSNNLIRLYNTGTDQRSHQFRTNVKHDKFKFARQPGGQSDMV